MFAAVDWCCTSWKWRDLSYSGYEDLIYGIVGRVFQQRACCCIKTWEGWPILTVKTGKWILKEYSPSLSCLGWSSRPSSKYLFPHHTLFQFICPLAQQAGEAAVPGRLSLNMCLWLCALEYKYACSTLKAIDILENRNDGWQDKISKRIRNVVRMENLS